MTIDIWNVIFIIYKKLFLSFNAFSNKSCKLHFSQYLLCFLKKFNNV